MKQQIKPYYEIEEDLKRSLNITYSRDNQAVDLFSNSIKQLKQFYGVELSLKYLKGLINDDDNKTKINRIKYLIKLAKFKIRKEVRYYDSLDITVYTNRFYIYSYSKDLKMINRKEQERKVGNFSKNHRAEVMYFVNY